MKPKYTESPWYVGNDICGEWYIHNNKGLVCSLETPVSQDYFTANLIAAAPELYEACVEFVRKVERGEARSTKSYEQMRQAIAKANGDKTNE